MPLDNLQLTCFNSSSLSWDVALSNFRDNLEQMETQCPIDTTSLWDLAYLLESSSIIPTSAIEDHLQHPCNIMLIQILLKLLPLLYIKTPDKKEYLINLMQTDTDCHEIDRLLSPNEEKRPEPVCTQVVTSDTPKRKLSHKGSPPSLVSKFPTIPTVATEFMKTNGFKAQEKRRNETFESCGVTVKQVREHLLDNVPGLRQHGISLTTVRYLFLPVHKSRSSARHYKGYIAAKTPKKDNSGRPETTNAHFIHSKVNLRLEHATVFSEDYTVISADAMNKVHVGTLGEIK